MGVIELAFEWAFIIEKLLDSGEGIVSDLLDEFFEFYGIWGGELSRVGIDDWDELSGGLSEEGVELF